MPSIKGHTYIHSGALGYLVYTLATPIPLSWGNSSAPNNTPHLSAEAESGSSDILVVGRRSGIARYQPQDRVTDKDIETMGADSVGDIISRITARMPGTAPAVIVNGKRLASTADVTELPAEAVERVDILPPAAGTAVGYSSTDPVINIVLRARFHSNLAELEASTSTQGGADAENGTFRTASITGERRTNISITYRRSSKLLMKDRLKPPSDSAESLLWTEEELASRSLLPDRDDISFAAGHTLPIGVNNLSLSADGAITRQQRWTGSSTEHRPIIERSQNRSMRVSATLSGSLGEFFWSLLGTSEFNRSQTSLNAQSASASPTTLAGRQSDYTSQRHSATGTFSGNIVTLPNGPLTLNARLSAASNQTKTHLPSPGNTHPPSLRRRNLDAQAGLTFPLLRSASSTRWRLGDVSAGANWSINQESGRGSAMGHESSLNWTLSPLISISASHASTSLPATATQLSTPASILPQLLIFDPITLTSVTADQITGGNPALQSSRQKSMTLRIALSQHIGTTNLSLATNYIRNDVTLPVIQLSPNAMLEQAFPERFWRDSGNHLLRFDARPINAARQRSEQISSNLHASGDFLPRNKPAMTSSSKWATPAQAHWEVSITHQWIIRNGIKLTLTSPEIDLMQHQLGSMGDSTPKHHVIVQAGLSTEKLGIQLDADWRNITRISAADAAGTEGRFITPLRINLQGYLNIGSATATTTNKMRIKLVIENLFNARPSARFRNGAAPFSLLPENLDPIGRTICLSLRKHL